jgi:probable phosphoglycerate mutase
MSVTETTAARNGEVVPTRVYLLRHGETANPSVFHGAESDVGLSDRGRSQAEALAPLLAARRPDGIVSSAMARARQTALPIATACSLPLRIEPALHERRVGALSGTPFHAPQGLWQETLARWVSGDTGFAPAGAESFDDIRARVLPVWRRLTEEFAHRTLVMVAHGVVCKVLLMSLIEGMGVADWAKLGPIRNAAIHELEHAGGPWRLLRFNDLPEAVSRM